MNNAERYWHLVNQKQNEISNLLLSGKAAANQIAPASVLGPNKEVQRVAEAVFITSIDNPNHVDHVAGRICTVPIRLAAQRLIDNTHRLSTEPEIEQWHQDGRDRKAFYDSEDAKKQRTFKVKLPEGV